MSSTPDATDRTYGIPPPEFRLPDATHLGGVSLLVSDLPRSVEYYETVIGLHVQSEGAEGVTLGTRGGDRPLVRLETREGVQPGRRGAFGLFHFAILLPARSALGRFAAHLSTLGVRAGMADHLVSEALYLADPDGLGIEIYADRPRSAWQRNGRELAMTTDPLDITDVIGAGGGASWNGAPPGTTMGHVHLHVGSLNDAEAFYHRALGFDKTVWSYPGALFFSAGGYHHHLGTNTWSPGPARSSDQAGLLEWELIVPAAADVAAAVASLGASGYEARPETADDATAMDPWGTQVCIRARG